MNILMKHITRNMSENSGRSAFIMISLFAVSILVSIISIGIIFFNIALDASKNLESFDYQIQSTTEDYILNDVVDEVKNKFDILGFTEPEYGYILPENENYITTPLEGLQIEDAIKFKIIDTDNKMELNANEAIVTSKIAKKLSLKENDEFEYYGRNGRKNILKAKYILKTVTLFGENVIITNEDTYSMITGKDDISYVYLIGSYTGNGNEIINDIDNFETKLGLDFDKSEKSLSKEIKGFIYPAVLVGILLFAVIFVSLNSIVKIIINERIPVIGTFRSIGATKKEILKVLILEMLMYTVIPSLVGSLVGMSLVKGIDALFEIALTAFGSNASIDITKYIFSISIITISFTILFQMLLSIFELIKVSKMSIKDTIFNKHVSRYKYSKLKIILGVFFLLIGLTNLINSNSLTYAHCIIGIISVFLSIAFITPLIGRYLAKVFEKSKNPVVIMAMNTLKHSSLQINTNIIFIVTISVSLVVFSFFNYSIKIEEAKQELVKSDIYVEEKDISLVNAIYDQKEQFYKLENVKSVSSIYDMCVSDFMYDEIKLANHKIKEIHLIYCENYESLLSDTNLINVDVNLAENLDKYEIIVSDYYKKVYNLNIGDTIILNWKSNEENFEISTPLNLKVVGFSDLSKLQNNTLIISKKLGEELNQLLFDGFSNTKYFINLKDDSDENAKETRKRIINELGIYSNGTNGSVFTKSGYIIKTEDNLKGYVVKVIISISIIVGLALIGIINNQIVSFMQRRKEFATLYSVAMSRKQLKDMILIENVLAFFNSIIASVVFYMVLLQLVEQTIQVLLIPIEIKFTIGGVIIIVIIASMILLAIQNSMRKHIKNMNIVEEIKYE